MWRTSILVLFLWWTSAVSAACNVSTVAVIFSSYQPRVNTPTYADGSIDVTCDPNTAYHIRLDAGGNSNGLYTQQALLEPFKSRLIYYNLYLDSAHTHIWGDGTAGTETASSNGVGTTQLFHVYGRIPSRQNVPIGTYGDSVTVTVDW